MLSDALAECDDRVGSGANPRILRQQRRRGGSGVAISKDDFGEDWPFLIDSGTLNCAPGDAVTFEADGQTYAVNGTAMGRAEAEGWRDMDPIWADDPAATGLKISIGPVIQRGLALCDSP